MYLQNLLECNYMTEETISFQWMTNWRKVRGSFQSNQSYKQAMQANQARGKRNASSLINKMNNPSFAFQFLNGKNFLTQNEWNILIFWINDKKPNEKFKKMLVLSLFWMKSLNEWRETFYSKMNQRLKSKKMFLFEKLESFLTDREAMWSMPSEGRKPNKQDLKVLVTNCHIQFNKMKKQLMKRSLKQSKGSCLS